MGNAGNVQGRSALVLVLLGLIACGGSSNGGDDDDAPGDGGSSAHGGSAHGRDRDAATADASTSANTDADADASTTSKPHDRADGGGHGGTGGEPPAGDAGDAATCVGSKCPDAATDSGCALDPHNATAAPAVLFVLDRSGSMASDWGGKTRADAVHAALVSALSPVASSLTVGALFFPSIDPNAPLMCADPTGIACTFTPALLMPSGNCDVNAITEPDQIDFTDGTAFLTALDEMTSPAPRYAPVPGGQTPLLQAFEGAQTALANAQRAAGTTVIVITDGDPNCEWDAASARTVIDAWLADGIELDFVVLPNTVASTTTMSLLASSGSNPTIVEPADTAELEHDLGEILSSRNGGPGGACLPEP